MPSIKVVPTADSSRIGYQQIQAAFGPGSTSPLQIVTSTGLAKRALGVARRHPEIAVVMPVQTSGDYAWGPVFFFAMIFAISTDYTVFLLSSQRTLGPHPRSA